MVDRDISGKMDWTWRADCMASSVAGCNFTAFFSLPGHLKERVYAVCPRIIGDLVARLQAAVTAVDAIMLRRVRENTVWSTAVSLEID
jgi:hypothetical protein